MKFKHIVLLGMTIIVSSFFINSKSNITKEDFIKTQATQRFKKVSFTNSQLKMDEDLAQKFREKLFKEKTIQEELKKDPRLLFKANQLVKNRGLFLADGLFNGKKVQFLISDANKCQLKIGDIIQIERKSDLNKICNVEYQNLFNTASVVNLTLKLTNLNNFSAELQEDLNKINNDMLEELAINSAYQRFLGKHI
jgi:hypothetical protein